MRQARTARRNWRVGRVEEGKYRRIRDRREDEPKSGMTIGEEEGDETKETEEEERENGTEGGK